PGDTSRAQDNTPAQPNPPRPIKHTVPAGAQQNMKGRVCTRSQRTDGGGGGGGGAAPREGLRVRFSEDKTVHTHHYQAQQHYQPSHKERERERQRERSRERERDMEREH